MAALSVCGAVLLAGCGSSGSDDDPDPPKELACDDSLMALDLGDPNAKITSVRAVSAGDALNAGGSVFRPPTEVKVASDFCLVQLNVGPGNPGPEGALSTSPGIGIEVWLPAPKAWNKRYQSFGGGGWAGSVAISDPEMVDALYVPQSLSAVDQGFVVSLTDTGHKELEQTGSFTMNPDGSINWTLLEDFAERGIYEQTVKAQAIAKAYYGEDIEYSYWNGCSTGGRQGLMLAQRHPQLFDGILVGAPVINWDRLIVSELWPQVVMQQDLGGPITPAKLNAVTMAAVDACDDVGGENQGYINDPGSCAYDPTKDAALLCSGEGGIGANGDRAVCLSLAEAEAVNKIWYGPTLDGTVPDPALDNGYSRELAPGQLWYGLTRGTDLNLLAGAAPFDISTDWVALALQDSSYAQPNFQNATGNGQNRWREISYLGENGSVPFYYVFDRSRQLFNSVIGTDNPDLTALRDAGTKVLISHATTDQAVFAQGTINYYERVIKSMGGLDATQQFARLYMMPGVGHCGWAGTPGAQPAYPGGAEELINDGLLPVLQAWVEKGEAPTEIAAQTAEGVTPAQTRPICLYPEQLAYVGGDVNEANSFACKAPI